MRNFSDLAIDSDRHRATFPGQMFQRVNNVVGGVFAIERDFLGIVAVDRGHWRASLLAGAHRSFEAGATPAIKLPNRA
jgi:hypothetical protein